MRMNACWLGLVVGCVGCTSGGLIGDEATPIPGPPPPEEVEIEADDGVILRGTWRQAEDAARNPGVLLLHQFGPNDDPGCSSERHDRSDFDGVVGAFTAAGISTLALDFRDHGASDPSSIDSTCSLLSDRDHLPVDVRAGLDWLRDRPLIVSRDHVGVAGVSVGANLALTTANRSTGANPDWGARGYVAVSARRDRAADFDPQGDESLAIDNALFVVAEDEEPQATQNQEMYDANVFSGANNELLFRPGSDHGAALLATDAVVRERMVSWFAELWPID